MTQGNTDMRQICNIEATSGTRARKSSNRASWPGLINSWNLKGAEGETVHPNCQRIQITEAEYYRLRSCWIETPLQPFASFLKMLLSVITQAKLIIDTPLQRNWWLQRLSNDTGWKQSLLLSKRDSLVKNRHHSRTEWGVAINLISARPEAPEPQTSILLR